MVVSVKHVQRTSNAMKLVKTLQTSTDPSSNQMYFDADLLQL